MTKIISLDELPLVKLFLDSNDTLSENNYRILGFFSDVEMDYLIIIGNKKELSENDFLDEALTECIEFCRLDKNLGVAIVATSETIDASEFLSIEKEHKENVVSVNFRREKNDNNQ